MAKKGLALIAVAGIAALAASGAGGSSGPRPLPPPPTPKPDENEGAVPEAILNRMLAALASQDPAKMRAEAAKLRAEGWTLQADDLEEAADQLEAISKTPSTSAPSTPPVATKPPATPAPAPAKPPATPAPAKPRDLARGMKGEDVRAWQRQLVSDGYVNIVPDADFGELTYAATREWQWERGLKDDGIVGPETRARIGTRPTRTRPAAVPVPTSSPAPAPAKPPAPAVQPPPVAPRPPPTSTPGASAAVPALLVNQTLRKVPPPEPTDERVKLWQDRLKALGYRSSTTKSDGKFGPNTEKQTAQLQRDRGLDPTGVADPVTIATAYGVTVAPPAAPKPKPVEPTPALPPLLVNLSTWRSVMQKGNKGEDVREWQQVLGRYGHDLTADGDFGALTHAATVQWQTEHARFNDINRAPLVPDGKVGKNTRDRIAELERGKSIVAGELDMLPRDVRSHVVPMLAPQLIGLELERHLRATPPGLEDRELVRSFQRAHGLNDTGVYGPATAEALIPLGIVPPDPREWPTKKLMRAKFRYRAALREQARRDPERSDEWLHAAARV
jgi:peptidoglycan hydrolase-like protein with peptidoglycan-binding domain